MQGHMQELPPSAMLDQVRCVVHTLGCDGRSFRESDIYARLETRKPVTSTVSSVLRHLARQGVITKVSAAPGAKKATSEYRLATTALPTPDHVVLVHRSQVTMEIPRTHEGLWALMRWLDREHGGFTEYELVRLVQHEIEAAAVTSYVRALDKAGAITLATKVGSARLYRVKRSLIETPRLRPDGTPLAGPQRFANMWRSMKMVTYFTALDLASAASLPELPITVEQAARYASDLAAAGYLLARERPGEPMLYRLKETRNTGPAAPEVLRARFVWDPNLCRVVGETTAIEEVRP